MTTNWPAKLEVPADNLDIFCLLYNIEVALRELIVCSLEKAAGPRWFRSRLHEDAKRKYLEGREYERTIKWGQMIPHHPIYYVEFPDLRIVIEKGDNWKDAFEPIFLRKNILSATLSEIEPIRNKIAHNRKATKLDNEIVQSAYSKLRTAIGTERFDELVRTCTYAADIPTRLDLLRTEGEQCLSRCMHFGILGERVVWASLKDQWWFDDEYLARDLTDVRTFFGLLDSYVELPHLRGEGYKIEAWVEEQKMPSAYYAAEKVLLSIV